jgi:hypothetical protein
MKEVTKKAGAESNCKEDQIIHSSLFFTWQLWIRKFICFNFKPYPVPYIYSNSPLKNNDLYSNSEKLNVIDRFLPIMLPIALKY